MTACSRSRFVAARIRTLMGTRRVLPTGRIFLLDGPQHFGLEIDRKLPNFVQKHRSTLCHGQKSILGLIRSGESAFDVAEQFAFDQGGDEGSAVHRNERLVTKGAGVVNGTCNQLLSGTASPRIN